MILTKRYLDKFLESMWISIPKSLKKELLDEYGHPVMDEEGHMHDYTEQDIYEQLRKRINKAMLLMGRHERI
jgi:hypothetical protein